MKWNEVWLTYCADRLGNPTTTVHSEPLSPADVLSLLSDAQAPFTARHDVIRSTPFDAAFDSEADNAIATLAMTDTFDSWNAISLGAWRIIADRYEYLVSLVMAANIAGVTVMTSLPRGLKRPEKTKAILIRHLLADARAIPPEWRPQ